MRIVLILLNWNNPADTLEALRSIEKLDYPNYEVIVVDNGSADDSVPRIKEAYPTATLIETGKNLGYAGGNNRGLEEGLKRDADLLFLLNNDTLVHKDLLKEIVKAAIDHPKAALFGPKIYYHDDPATIWYAGGSIDPKTGKCFHIGVGEPWGHDEIAPTDYVCGCALAVRREAVEEVGLMDERFFLLWEEIDWCYRIREAGMHALFVPKARLWHKISASFPEGNRGPMWQYYYHRNQRLFHEKRGTKKPSFFPLLKQGLNPRLPSDEKKQARAALLGVRDYYFRKFGALAS